jgi:NAD(P)-dependent dehydrogenase (short-subunit alcohol dehydrogenase family)
LLQLAPIESRVIVTSSPCLAAQVNNAGVLLNERKLTPEGYEMNFATNTLGTYLLTELMLPVLEQSAPSRVVCRGHSAASNAFYNSISDGKIVVSGCNRLQCKGKDSPPIADHGGLGRHVHAEARQQQPEL